MKLVLIALIAQTCKNQPKIDYTACSKWDGCDAKKEVCAKYDF